MAGLLEGIVGGITGGAGYLAGAAKTEQNWKEKDDYLQAKLDAQQQLFGMKLDAQKEMLTDKLAAARGGGGGKSAALPVTDEDYQTIGELSGVPRPQIDQYRNYIKSGQYPTMNQPVTVPNEGQRVDAMLNEGRVIQNVDDAQMDRQVTDPVAEKNINDLGKGIFGTMVHRALNPALYDGVMKGDQQMMKNGVIEEAIRSKDPKNIPAMAAIVRAIDGNSFYAGGENVVTGKLGEKGNREVVVKEQNANTNSKEAETKDETARFERSPEGIGSKRDHRKDGVFREIETRQEDLRIVMRELAAIKNKAPTSPEYAAKLKEISKIKGEINAIRQRLDASNPSTPAPAPRNYLTDPIPKVGW